MGQKHYLLKSGAYRLVRPPGWPQVCSSGGGRVSIDVKQHSWCRSAVDHRSPSVGQGKSGDPTQLSERLVGVRDLDRVHSKCPSRFEVDAEVVQEHRLAGFDSEGFASQLVETGIGLAYAEDTRLEDGIEEGIDRGNLAGQLGLGADEVVGETSCLERLPAAADRLDHLGPDLPGETFENEPAVDVVTAQCESFRSPEVAELVHAHLTALEAGPCIVIRIGRVDLSDEAAGELQFVLEMLESLERAGRDHAAKIEHYCLNAPRPILARRVLRRCETGLRRVGPQVERTGDSAVLLRVH